MMTLFMELNMKNLQLEIIKTGSILLWEQGLTGKQKTSESVWDSSLRIRWKNIFNCFTIDVE